MSKLDVLNWFAGSSASLSVAKIMMVLCVALVLAGIIFFTYMISYSGVSYNARFNATNLLITIITAVIMLMIGSNVALSLGMVGALSIVRYRTAIKDPQDTVYIFWSIVTGLCVGAGVYQLAVVSCIFIAIVVLAMSFYTKHTGRYIVIVRGSADTDKSEVEKKLLENFKKVVLRAANNREESVEMIFEIRAAGSMKCEIIDSLKMVDGVKSANWILESGENIG